MKTSALSIVMFGATGAVGGEVVKTLRQMPNITRLCLLGRRILPELSPETGGDSCEPVVEQQAIDIFDPSSYADYMTGHDVAICTLGVGQPSKISRDEFLKIDKLAVLDFATACKAAGVKHFELLSSVGIHPRSSSFFLRTKGELVEELKALKFERLSIFQPSMILTPNNRYGVMQAMTLSFWPRLTPILIGTLRKFRGVSVEQLGRAIAQNIRLETREKRGVVEYLTWDEFQDLGNNISIQG